MSDLERTIAGLRLFEQTCPLRKPVLGHFGTLQIVFQKKRKQKMWFLLTKIVLKQYFDLHVAPLAGNPRPDIGDCLKFGIFRTKRTVQSKGFVVINRCVFKETFERLIISWFLLSFTGLSQKTSWPYPSSSLPLQATLSTHKFSRLIFLHFLEEWVERIW